MISQEIIDMVESAIEDQDVEKMKKAIDLVRKVEAGDSKLIRTRHWMSFWINHLQELSYMEESICRYFDKYKQ